ncbi:hypothetical protein M885DRAFT_578514 [Pelagophyceae sp. CCMP2097]|nr:hypothetical protein M885DRAFT_578514 [Pelagophyceae sp. CCMP2097]
MAALLGHRLGVEPSEMLVQVLRITGHDGAASVSPVFLLALEIWDRRSSWPRDYEAIAEAESLHDLNVATSDVLLYLVDICKELYMKAQNTMKRDLPGLLDDVDARRMYLYGPCFEAPPRRKHRLEVDRLDAREAELDAARDETTRQTAALRMLRQDQTERGMNSLAPPSQLALAQRARIEVIQAVAAAFATQIKKTALGDVLPKADGGSGKFTVAALAGDPLLGRLLATAPVTSDLSEASNGIATMRCTNAQTVVFARLQAGVAGAMNGGGTHTAVQKRRPYNTKKKRIAAAEAPTSAWMPEAAAAGGGAAAAKKAQYEIHVVRAWTMFNNPAERPRLLALVHAAFNLPRCQALQDQNRQIEAKAQRYQLAARAAVAAKLARKAAELAAQTERNWNRRGEYIGNAAGLREILKKVSDTGRQAAIVEQLGIRKFAFGFDVSGKQFMKKLPHEKLIDALVSNLAAERRQGVPKTMPVVELGSVPAMAFEDRSRYFKDQDGAKRRAPSAAAESTTRRVKTAGVKKTAVAAPSLKHHRKSHAGKNRRSSPCTDESPGPPRPKRAKVMRIGLGDYERPRAP